MNTDRLAVGAAVDDAAWRIVELHLAADEMALGDPKRAPLLDEASTLRRRIDALLLD